MHRDRYKTSMRMQRINVAPAFVYAPVCIILDLAVHAVSCPGLGVSLTR